MIATQKLHVRMYSSNNLSPNSSIILNSMLPKSKFNVNDVIYCIPLLTYDVKFRNDVIALGETPPEYPPARSPS